MNQVPSRLKTPLNSENKYRVTSLGKRVTKTIPEALNDFHLETVIIKGANAIDASGKVGVISSGFDGGTMGATLGTAVSHRVLNISYR